MFNTFTEFFKSSNHLLDSIFLSSEEKSYSYAQLKAFTSYFGNVLLNNIEDDTFLAAFISESSDEMVFTISACWLLGIPFVTINPNTPDTELENHLKTLRPNIIFTDSKNSLRFDFEHTIILNDAFLTKALVYKENEINDSDIVELDDDLVFGYFFTSGSTSFPKIVPLKRRQMLSAAQASAKNIRPDRNHYWILCMPLNHIGGITVIIRSIIYGSAIYRMDEFDEYKILPLIRQNSQFQAVSLVPTMLKRLFDIPGFRTHKSFKAILLGGGPAPNQLLKKSVERAVPVISSYGMTETCAQIAANDLLRPSGVYTPYKSVGKPFKPNEVQIRDESGHKVGKNQSGTIWLKGPQIFDGYLIEEHNEGRFDENGWFNTGDYGHINMFGLLFVESRRTDLIITGGENVNPAEVEQALDKVATFQECVVLGLPDDEWGQKIIAFIKPEKDIPVDAEEIRLALKQHLVNYKIPKNIIVVDDIPKTTIGKVNRWKLIENLSQY